MAAIDMRDLEVLPAETKVLVQSRREEQWQSLLIVSLRTLRTCPELFRGIESELRAVVLQVTPRPGAAVPYALH
jgi:hypothetical protein